MSGNGGHGRGRGGGRGNYQRRRGGRGGFRAKKNTWTSTHKVLKDDVFTEGTAESAALFVDSLKKFIEYVRGSTEEKESNLIAQAIEQEAIPLIRAPPRPNQIEDPNNPGVMIDDDVELAIWQEQVKMVAKRRSSLEEGLKRQYAVLTGQCSPAVIGRLKGEAGWEQVDQDKNPVVLVQRIRRVCCGFDAHKQPVYSLVQAIKMLTTHIQKGESNEKYKESIEALFNIIEQFGGSLTNHPVLIERRAVVAAGDDPPRDPDQVNDDDVARATEELDKEIKAAFMLSGANNSKYGALKDTLENAYTLGDDKYPRDMEQTLGQLNNYIGPRQARHNQPYPHGGGSNDDEDGVQCLQADGDKDASKSDAKEGAVMAQAKTKTEGKEEKTNKQGESGCYHCGDTSHWIMNCSKLTEAKKGQLFLQLDGAMVSQVYNGDHTKTGGLVRTRLYLDTCTTDDQMANPAYLTGVHKADKPLRLHTNAGTSISRLQGYLGSHKFWIDPQGIANVISLRSLEKKYRVTYDSAVAGGAFVVHTDRGEIRFVRCPDSGFPYVDLDDHTVDVAAMLVQSVRGNYEGFTRREIEKAKAARELQGQIGHPSDQDFKTLIKAKDNVSQSLLHDCPTTLTDVTNAQTIFGPSLPRMKGTSVRTKPIRMEPDYVRIPREIVEMNRNVTLVGDVLFVCGLPFLITLSRRIRFVTLQFMPNRTVKELTKGFKNVLNLYKRAGFLVQCALMDNEFEPLKQALLDCLDVNTTAKNEHVGEIERKIRHVKERARCVKSTLPYRFKALPNAIIKAMLYNVILWMNAFISPQGVSETYSPRELVLRRQLKWKLHARANFGCYFEAYDEPGPNETNTQAERTVACINLGPTGNFQGTHKFFNLATGRVIKRRSFKELPMPDSVIERVNYWGLKDKQQANSLAFRNRNNDRFDWDDDVDGEALVSDNAVEPVPEPEPAPFPDIPAEMPGITLERDLPTPAIDPEPDTAFKQRAAAAANANFAPNLAPHVIEDDRSGTTQNINNNVVYNFNVQRSENDDGPPNLVRPGDDDYYDTSDEEDETYAPEEEDEESEDLDPNDYQDDRSAEEDCQDDRSAGEEEPEVRRSGRDRAAPVRFHDEFQFLQAHGRWKEADAAEKLLSEHPPEGEIDEPIELNPGEDLVLGAIMVQLSLKQGLKKWGKRGEESAMKEMTQICKRSSRGTPTL